MGISTNVYTVHGIRIDWDDDFSNAFDEVYEKLEASVIMDRMSGEYIVIGDILFDSGDARWEPLSGFSTIDLSKLEEGKSSVKSTFTECLPQFAHLLDRDWSLMTFVHYS